MSNFIENPGFEILIAPDKFANWNQNGAVLDNTTLPHTGLHAAQIGSSESSGSITQFINKTIPAGLYQLSFYARTIEEGIASLDITLIDSDIENVLIRTAALVIANGYTVSVFNFELINDTNGLTLSFGNNRGPSVLIDDVSIALFGAGGGFFGGGGADELTPESPPDPNNPNPILCTSCSCLINSPCVHVPLVNIVGRFTAGNQDIAYVIFTICDEFKHYCSTPCQTTKCYKECKQIYVNSRDISETRFGEYNVPLKLVLNGTGTTLKEKVHDLYITFNIRQTLGIEEDVFYNNVVLYGMAIYILARLIYGYFDIKFLLGKYFERFLRDLANSRFCNFVQFFTDPASEVFGYNNYYKFDSNELIPKQNQYLILKKNNNKQYNQSKKIEF